MIASREQAARPEWAAGLAREAVLGEIAGLCSADHSYPDGTIFNSICSEPLEVASEVFAANLASNMGDHRIFPSLPRTTALVTAMLGDLLDHPAASGVPTSGATEANLLAVLIAARSYRGPGLPRIVLGRNAHFSLEKIVAMLPVEPVWVDLDHRLRVDPVLLAETVERCDPALVVLTAGTSESGAVDDIEAIAPRCAQAGVRVHVDGATGGFLVPFAKEAGHPISGCGFAIPGVQSISVDPHKYARAPIPSGYLLTREAADLERLRSASHYHGQGDHFGLLGTRPGAALLGTYAALRYLGRDGLRAAAAGVFRRRSVLLRLLGDAGLPLHFQPDLMVVGVSHPDPVAAQQEMQGRGLIVSVSRRYGFIRIVVHLHQTYEQLGRLAEELAAIS